MRAKELRKTRLREHTRKGQTGHRGGYQSGGNCTCGGGSTLEAVVFYDVDIFLDFLAIVLEDVGGSVHWSGNRPQDGERHHRYARQPNHFLTTRVFAIARVQDTPFAMARVAVHDGSNAVALEVL